jgi:hypothetical protein
MVAPMTTSNYPSRSVVLVLLLGLIACAVNAAEAQSAAPPGPGDFAVAVWGGYTTAKVDCANCEAGATYRDTWQAGVAPLWRVNNKVLAGVEFVYQPSSQKNRSRSSSLLASVMFHPWATSGFYIKGGYGLAWVRTTFTVDGVDQKDRFNGMAVNYGIGWRFRQHNRVSFGLFGSHYITTAGTVVVQSLEAVNVIGNGWVGGVSVFVR